MRAFLILISFVLSSSLLGLEKKQVNHVLCGPTIAKKTNDSRCPVKSYVPTANGDICGWNYETKASMSCSGSVKAGYEFSGYKWSSAPSSIDGEKGNPIVGGHDIRIDIRKDKVQAFPHTRSLKAGPWHCKIETRPSGRTSFAAMYKCETIDFPAKCSIKSTAKSCDIGSGTPASWHPCDVKVSDSSVCEMYMTPEALDQYIIGMESKVSMFQEVFPSRKSDVFSTAKDEAGLHCLIKEYSTDMIYDELISELKDTYFLLFGDYYEDRSFSCDEATSVAIDVLDPEINGITCSSLDKDALRNLEVPAGESMAAFQKFRDRCRAIKSYEALVVFFEETREEIEQLKTDLPAKNDPTKLESLNILLEDIANTLNKENLND